MRPKLTSVGSGRPQPRRIFKPLERPRVSQLLDSAHAYAVTVLVAGAGYGKSVALEHWLAHQQETVVRYDVREGSHGVLDFALGLASALAPTIKLGARAAAHAVNAADKAGTPDVDLAAWFGNALRKFRGTIVIDDLHAAAEGDPRVAKLIARVVELSGEHIRWVIASRVPCGLPITSWIAYGQSQMAIGERDLTFTHDEAAATSTSAGSTFSAAQLNELYAYTGGWPTAMIFAMLTAERTLDLQELRATTQELSYQYLAEQVLHSLPEEDATLLLQTSVFDRIDINVLTEAEIENPRERLQFLQTHATFVRHASDGSVRYHDLFRDFLRSELARSDTEFKPAWNRAGRTYERLGQYGRAMAAYQNAGAHDDLRRVLEERGFTLIERGKRGAVSRALDGLGVALDLERHPVVLALRANCEANSGDPKRAEAWYRAAVACAQSPAQEAELRLQFARELMQENRREGAEILEPALRDDLPLELKVAVMGSLATHYWHAGRRESALEMIASALELSAPIIDDEVRATLMHQSAYLLLLSGKVKEAGERALQTLQLAKPLDLHALCARTQSLLLYIDGTHDNVAQALWWTKQMQRSAADAGDMTLTFTALCGAYELEVERGNYEVLAQLAEQLRDFDAERYIRAKMGLLPAFAMQAAWQGRFEEAVSILAGSHLLQPIPSRRALRAAELALFSAAAGKRSDAEAFCLYVADRLREEDHGEPYIAKRHAKTLVWLALSQLLLGKLSSANRAIGDAERLLHILAPRSRALVRAARSMFVHLETRALEEDVEEAFRMLEETGSAGLARMLRTLPMPTLKREGTSAILTRTEIEVLRSLERFGQSKAAAADLGKSSQTIDWHVKAIKKKLGVKTRHEAILFARDRGLIG